MFRKREETAVHAVDWHPEHPSILATGRADKPHAPGGIKVCCRVLGGCVYTVYCICWVCMCMYVCVYTLCVCIWCALYALYAYMIIMLVLQIKVRDRKIAAEGNYQLPIAKDQNTNTNTNTHY